ncbi:hypothetical protein JTE90_022839 [Oedothorax gibbosus]|uniref:BED-type domain-containing protein n=1 Tax=Oedothorax gibbosus TaxID=931172 RepID=A0AAV6TLT6_9ARAC|nr:hypothetical protein JTE90_022839 [Oedothorax gibbosus]
MRIWFAWDLLRNLASSQERTKVGCRIKKSSFAIVEIFATDFVWSTPTPPHQSHCYCDQNNYGSRIKDMEIFNKVSGAGDVVECTVCRKRVKTGGGTSNMRRHMTTAHPKYATVSVQNVSTGAGTSTEREACDVDAPDPQPGASSSTTPSTSAVRIEISSGGKRSTDLNDALIYMICKDNLPHSMVEKEGFSHFARVAVPLYKVPSRKTVTEMVSSRYFAAIEMVKEKLVRVKHISLSADTCTVTNTSKAFLVLTVHFVDPQTFNHLETIMLGVRRLRESHTAQNIADSVNEVLSEFGIPNKKIAGICTDGGSNVRAMVDILVGSKKICVLFRTSLKFNGYRRFNRCKQQTSSRGFNGS